MLYFSVVFAFQPVYYSVLHHLWFTCNTILLKCPLIVCGMNDNKVNLITSIQQNRQLQNVEKDIWRKIFCPNQTNQTGNELVTAAVTKTTPLQITTHDTDDLDQQLSADYSFVANSFQKLFFWPLTQTPGSSCFPQPFIGLLAATETP